MQLAVLGQKQKRLRTWQNYLECERLPEPILSATREYLNEYAQIIFRCYETAQISDSDSKRFENLERILEDLNEQARLSPSPTSAPDKSGSQYEAETL
ncbi:MAG: hypothetical protein KDD42_07705 [Bdellovibrionales bacterium]|nr:hypothetical protein [Bdellovibrionales bacterium]